MGLYIYTYTTFLRRGVVEWNETKRTILVGPLFTHFYKGGSGANRYAEET